MSFFQKFGRFVNKVGGAVQKAGRFAGNVYNKIQTGSRIAKNVINKLGNGFNKANKIAKKTIGVVGDVAKIATGGKDNPVSRFANNANNFRRQVKQEGRKTFDRANRVVDKVGQAATAVKDVVTS